MRTMTAFLLTVAVIYCCRSTQAGPVKKMPQRKIVDPDVPFRVVHTLPPPVTNCTGAGKKVYQLGAKWEEMLRGHPNVCRCLKGDDIHIGMGPNADRMCRMVGCLSSKGSYLRPKENKEGCRCIPGNNPNRIDGHPDLFHCETKMYEKAPVLHLDPLIQFDPLPVMSKIKLSEPEQQGLQEEPKGEGSEEEASQEEAD